MREVRTPGFCVSIGGRNFDSVRENADRHRNRSILSMTKDRILGKAVNSEAIRLRSSI
ncbi:hypothetical protein LEP1GSC047_2292 [Leptospira inadai serovar Lyme str. 10]|uniref:Uncharacterized protein n=1 Tax=Leptospira inadai serovar Lyme str. 10 TaxID=1049790 RepID=V6HNN1_9LEPT|nr:hypothetical protein LEP1GSC047_2292 [Leptospira inadai serovar Lyme str. 10]